MAAKVTPSIEAAIRDYRRSIRDVVFWQGHGTHGDGRLEQARGEERRALEQLRQAIRDQD